MIQTSPALTENALTVVRAFQRGKWTYRTIGGLAEDSGLKPETVQHAINELIVGQFADQYPTNDGLRFYLTRKGRSVALELAQSA